MVTGENELWSNRLLIMVILMVMMIEMTLGDKQMLTLFARPIFADQKIGGPLNVYLQGYTQSPPRANRVNGI